MCGRYLRRSDKQKIAEAFRVSSDLSNIVMPPWDYNVAPTTFQPIIRNHRDTGERELELMRWGMVPHFAKSLADWKGISTINARAETILSRPLWKVPFERRRCLVPADGFYEWKRLDPKTRKPYVFTMSNEQPFAFAGLWDAWKDPAGTWLQSFTVITTDANEVMSAVHDRMPVILHARDFDRWLERPVNREELPGQLPVDLLRPYEADAMRASACNPLVGNVRNNGPEMLDSPPEVNSA